MFAMTTALQGAQLNSFLENFVAHCFERNRRSRYAGRMATKAGRQGLFKQLDHLENYLDIAKAVTLDGPARAHAIALCKQHHIDALGIYSTVLDWNAGVITSVDEAFAEYEGLGNGTIIAPLVPGSFFIYLGEDVIHSRFLWRP